MLMAGLDGIRNKIDPGEPDGQGPVRTCRRKRKQASRTCATRWDQALDELDANRDFLKAGDVFNDDAIDGYIELKR